MLVCKDWNQITTPFLYEHIRLDDRHRADQLLRTLSRKSGGRLASLILRLDLVIEQLTWECGHSTEALTPNDEWSNAARICFAVPNLTTLVMASTNEGERRIADIVSPCLRHICFLHTFTLSISDWVAFMDKHPVLESADPPRLRDDKNHSGSVIATSGKRWPSIKELIFHIALDIDKWARWFLRGAFPNLHRVVIRTSIEPHEEEVFSNFLCLHGSNLETIELTDGYESGAQSSIPDRLFPILSEYCPKLNHVVWTISDMDDLVRWENSRGCHTEPINDRQLPGITSFTLQTLEPPESVVVDALYHWVRCLPSVRKIVMLEADLDILRADYSNSLQTFVSWLHDIGRNRGIKIELEDEYGIQVR